jgi:hypothetical protein
MIDAETIAQGYCRRRSDGPLREPLDGGKKVSWLSAMLSCG